MQLAWLRLSRQRVINQQDGFTFGNERSIYNPWSITSFLNERSLAPYWVNTSSNGLVSSLVRRGDEDLKADFETLLEGGSLRKRIDQAVSFESLYASPAATWSLLLATGYLRVAGRGERYVELFLELTNREVREGFYGMVRDWFEPAARSYNAFVRALLADDADGMEAYLADLAEGVMSSFDSGARPSRTQPERFWHGCRR